MIPHSESKTIQTEEEKQQQMDRLSKQKETMSEFLKIRREWKTNGKTIDELIEYTTKIMNMSEDCPTVFNFRKELIEAKIYEILNTQKAKDENDDQNTELKGLMEPLKAFLSKELMFMSQLVLSSPKSYEIWFHRLWLLQKLADLEIKHTNQSANAKALMTKDLAICEKFLAKDDRNFHVWNYRIEVNKKLLALSSNSEKIELVTKELDFIRTKIDENFSNYSALHFFTKYVQMKADLLYGSCIHPSDIIDVFKSNCDALFISPNEQALWMFQRWCLDNIRDLQINYIELSYDKLVCYFNKIIDKAQQKLLKVAINGQSINQLEPILNQNCLKIENFNKDDNIEITINYVLSKNTITIVGGKLNFDNQRSDNNHIEDFKAAFDMIEQTDIDSLETQLFKPLNLFYSKKAIMLSKRFDSFEVYVQSCRDLLTYLIETTESNKLALENCYFSKLIIELRSTLKSNDTEKLIEYVHAL